VEEAVSSERNRDKKRNNIKQALTIQALKMVASQTTAFAMDHKGSRRDLSSVENYREYCKVASVPEQASYVEENYLFAIPKS